MTTERTKNGLLLFCFILVPTTTEYFDHDLEEPAAVDSGQSKQRGAGEKERDIGISIIYHIRHQGRERAGRRQSIPRYLIPGTELF